MPTLESQAVRLRLSCRGLMTLVGLAAALVSARSALAGDADAHRLATLKSARLVASMPEFANGVGARNARGEAFLVPTDCETNDAVNLPDKWECAKEGDGPEELQRLNKAL